MGSGTPVALLGYRILRRVDTLQVCRDQAFGKLMGRDSANYGFCRKLFTFEFCSTLRVCLVDSPYHSLSFVVEISSTNFAPFSERFPLYLDLPTQLASIVLVDIKHMIEAGTCL